MPFRDKALTGLASFVVNTRQVLPLSIFSKKVWMPDKDSNLD
ncbi:hypothetical protein SJA_C1-09800 [Sphingobium indicum UT26S]|uniref:Uncharacterized protein n=1 Tax=Sphingobium indicum (strain DSM 16413 / CCM 7287 / MTCC 6362 / UT26 / NBRC 101211 / UT26S) TaxID=452662 RepID=D4YZN2_SPHIU|nr:hypothetical protein SJA_C1-09800 [Sphingobium indicum UT26S]